MSEKAFVCKKCGNRLVLLDTTEVRKEYPNAYVGWSLDHDQLVTDMYRAGDDLVDIARKVGRPTTAVSKRITQLRLDEKREKKHLSQMTEDEKLAEYARKYDIEGLAPDSWDEK